MRLHNPQHIENSWASLRSQLSNTKPLRSTPFFRALKAIVPLHHQIMKQTKELCPYRCAGDALAAGAQRRGVLWRRGQLACEGAVKWRVHVGQRWARAARVQEKFGGGWRRGADLDEFHCHTANLQCHNLRRALKAVHLQQYTTQYQSTHSQSGPASALLTSCGCSSCQRARAAWRAPAAAQSCTLPDPPAWSCSEQHCCCCCCPPSSASLHGSYSGPVLQRQEPATSLSDEELMHVFREDGWKLNIYRIYRTLIEKLRQIKILIWLIASPFCYCLLCAVTYFHFYARDKLFYSQLLSLKGNKFDRTNLWNNQA